MKRKVLVVFEENWHLPLESESALMVSAGIYRAEQIDNPIVEGGMPCLQFPDLGNYWVVENYLRRLDKKGYGIVIQPRNRQAA